MSEAFGEIVAPRSPTLSTPAGEAQRDEILEQIYDELAAGRTITELCADPSMPGVSTFFRWISGDEARWAAYLRARETQAHVFASKVIDEAYSSQDAGIGRLRVDALKWYASKLGAKYYGDNTQVRLADANGAKLDTAPLVSELLSLMSPNTVSATLISDTPAPRQDPPTRRLRDDAEDLV